MWVALTLSAAMARSVEANKSMTDLFMFILPEGDFPLRTCSVPFGWPYADRIRPQ